MGDLLHNTILWYNTKDDVTSSQPSAFSQDLLQFLSGSASNEGSDQGQRVRVEISLKRQVISLGNK